MTSSRAILVALWRSAAYGCCLIAMFGRPPVAAAQVLYKSILPDGRVVYGDKPASGAAKVIEKQPDPSTAGLGGTSPREVQLLEEFRNARIQRESAEERVRAAQNALRARIFSFPTCTPSGSTEVTKELTRTSTPSSLRSRVARAARSSGKVGSNRAPASTRITFVRRVSIFLKSGASAFFAMYGKAPASSTPALDRTFRRLSHAADRSVLWLSMAGAMAVVPGRPRRAAVLGSVSIGVASAAVNLVAKQLATRPRPDRGLAGSGADRRGNTTDRPP